MHACDVSQQGRKFGVAKEWTYLLFDEFFDQGDLEKYKNLPITMLCDRVTVNVAASQPGFISFIPLPLMISLSNVLPDLHNLIQ
jgi:cAMP-specific phosphodiesterase 4/calcium/calmodulin-dependent 3',5'-cyclic nucleotide phosphodiesterase